MRTTIINNCVLFEIIVFIFIKLDRDGGHDYFQ